jgi:uronate dehydrogenase
MGLELPDLQYEVVYGMSDNKRAWWDNANALRLGYAPQDRSEDYASEILAQEAGNLGDPLADRLQGGVFVSTEFIPNPAKAKLSE